MTWTERDLAYLAGLIDGEGHVSLTHRNNGRGRYYQRLSLFISNTDARMIRWLREKFGGSISVHRYAQPNYRQLWRWAKGDAELDSLLAAVQPFLVTKVEQVDLALEFRSTVRPNRGLDDATKARRATIKGKLLVLNRRGFP